MDPSMRHTWLQEYPKAPTSQQLGALTAEYNGRLTGDPSPVQVLAKRCP